MQRLFRLSKNLTLMVFFVSHLEAGIIGYVGGGSPAGLYGISEASGQSAFVTSVQATLASGGLANMDGLFYATNYTPNSGIIPPTEYGIVDTVTGAFTVVGSQGTSGNWYGFSVGPLSGELYVYEEESNTLKSLAPGHTIDSSVTVTGLLNVGGIRGMAYDPINGIMYATDYYDPTPHLYRLNLQTGTATLIGALGLTTTHFGGHVPLAFDPISQTLFAADDVSRSLFTLNVNTGAASPVGSLGALVQPIGSMTWVADSNQSTPEPGGFALCLSALAIGGFVVRYRARFCVR
jgi:hypothetical protein